MSKILPRISAMSAPMSIAMAVPFSMAMKSAREASAALEWCFNIKDRPTSEPTQVRNANICPALSQRSVSTVMRRMLPEELGLGADPKAFSAHQ